MVPLRAYSGISESLEVALHVYSSRDCSTIRLNALNKGQDVPELQHVTKSCQSNGAPGIC